MQDLLQQFISKLFHSSKNIHMYLLYKTASARDTRNGVWHGLSALYIHYVIGNSPNILI